MFPALSVSNVRMLRCVSVYFFLYLYCFQSYFKDSWNTFDFITVLGSIVDALMVEFAVSLYNYLRFIL